MPTGWTPTTATLTLEEWTCTFSRGQQYSCFTITVFYGVQAGEQKVCEWGPKYGKFDDSRWQTRWAAGIIVGRRECSSTWQQTGATRMDVHVDTYSQPCPQATGCGHSGAAPRFWKWGGDNFASGASKKNFFDPPTFWPVGGDKILLR